MQKTIIITGATSGIGKALAEHLAELNHNVIAIGRNKQSLKNLQSAFPENIKTIEADLTKKEDLLLIKESLDPKTNGMYIVHNAGIALPQYLSNLTEEEWDLHYLTNTKSIIFLTQMLLSNLKNGGRVLNISTGLAHKALPAFAAYGITKSSIYMWKEFCNVELNKERIFFGSAMPGVVDTTIQENIRKYDTKKFPIIDMFNNFKEKNELLAPSIVAKFLTWLLFETNENDFIQGDWDIYDKKHQKYWTETSVIRN